MRAKGRRCVVILANDMRGEAAFPELVRAVLGETGAPWRWEYGEMEFWRPSQGDSVLTLIEGRRR